MLRRSVCVLVCRLIWDAPVNRFQRRPFGVPDADRVCSRCCSLSTTRKSRSRRVWVFDGSSGIKRASAATWGVETFRRSDPRERCPRPTAYDSIGKHMVIAEDVSSARVFANCELRQTSRPPSTNWVCPDPEIQSSSPDRWSHFLSRVFGIPHLLASRRRLEAPERRSSLRCQ